MAALAADRAPTAGRIAGRMAVLAAALLLGACASTPPPPPAHFDPAAVTLIATTAPPQPALAGIGSRRETAGKGALTGGGIGFGVGAMACSATGPLAALCFVTVLPGATVFGVAAGGATGALIGESAASLAAKRKTLEALIGARAWPLELARTLADEARTQHALQWPLDAAEPTPWELRLGLKALGSTGTGSHKPYALFAVMHAELWRAGETRPAWSEDFLASGTRLLDDTAWATEAPLEVQGLLRQLSAQLLQRLLPAASRPASPRT